MNKIIAAFFLVCGITTVCGIVCLPNACDTVRCAAPTCQNDPNYTIQPGGFCNCCEVCYQIIGEGGDCAGSPIRGVPDPNPKVCASGLVCTDGVCVSGN